MQNFGSTLFQGQYWISKAVHSPACTCVACLQISCSLQSGQLLLQKLSPSPCLYICSSYLARTENANHQQTLSVCRSAAAIKVCMLTLCHMRYRDICSLCCQYRSQHRLTVAILPVLSAVLTVRTSGCCKAPLLLLPHVNKVYSAKSCSRRMADTAVQRPCLSTSSVGNVSGSHKSV